MNLIAVTTYYNPCRFKRRLDNYRRFRDRLLRQGVPLFTIEQATDGAPPEITPAGELYQLVTTGDVMWQKERLLNHAFAQLPREYDAIAWLDCDILFVDPDWRVKAERLLEELAVIQLYQIAIHLPRDQHEYQGEGHVLPGYLAQQRRGTTFAQIGFAWAARRSILERHGLFDLSIVGSGDSYILHALDGNRALLSADHRPPALWACYVQWAEAFAATVDRRYGYLPATVLHLWHGDIFDRGYDSRHQILLDGQFDPAVDLRVNASGAWEWASDKPQLHQAVRAYFATRREDGPAVAAAGSYGLLSWVDSLHLDRLCAMVSAARARLGQLPVFLYDCGLSQEERRRLDAANIQHAIFPPLFAGLLGVSASDGRRWVLPEMLSRSPYLRTVWIDPDAGALPDPAALFSALAHGPILFTTPGKDPKQDPVGTAAGQQLRLEFNNCVIGVDLEREAGMLDEWRHWVWSSCLYPHLRALMAWSLAPTDYIADAAALRRDGPKWVCTPPGTPL